MDRDEELFRELRRVVREDPTGAQDGDAQPADLLDRPDAIPGYELKEELFRGGQGVVYRAEQTATHREVALKVLLRGRDASARDRLRFEREIDLASRLRHPDIVTIYDSGIANGRSYFAMEYVSGDRLDVYVAKHGPDLETRLRLFRRIADAVAAAHRRGVIHRDLKPGNILVDGDGDPHVLDFGIAKAAGETAPGRVTATGEFMGTLAYASPEQVQGDPADVDTRSDVYSLGVLLYELLTGRFPYDVTGTMAQVVENVTRRGPTDPRTFAPQVDAELRTILTTALAKDPAERYASADALARDVGHYLAREPIEARGKSTWYVLRKSMARNRLPLAAGLVALALASVAGFLLVRERLRAERQGENAKLVRGILEDVLSAAAPQRMGSDVTLLEIYDEASDRIESALEDSPDAQAAFHLTIGDTYRSLLMWPEARDHLRKALERYRAVEGAELEVARCLDLYGLVLSELDPPSALPVLEEALTLRGELLDEEHVDVARSERSLAIGLLSQYADQDRERARELLLSSLSKFAAALGRRHPEVGATKLWLARIEVWNGRLPDAQRLYEEALAIFEQEREVDPRMVDALTALSNVNRTLERFDAAREYLDQAVTLTSELYGDERDVEMLRSYADIHFDQGEYVTAERLTRQACVKELERWARKRPEDAARIANVQRRLQITEDAGGEPPYAEAFAILRECRGNGSFELANWANGIALTLIPQGRGAAAEPLLKEVLNIRCRAFGMDCPVRVETLLLLARELTDQERFAEAVPLLEEILETAERVERTDSKEAVEAHALLERCRDATVTKVG